MNRACGLRHPPIGKVHTRKSTQAGFTAHNVSRNNYAEIGQEMIYDSAVDVIMGAGHPFFDDDGLPQVPMIPADWRYVGGELTWWELVAGIAGGDADGDGIDDPWMLIEERAEFQALMNGPTPKRVVGVAQVEDTLQQNRGGDHGRTGGRRAGLHFHPRGGDGWNEGAHLRRKRRSVRPPSGVW